MAPVPSPMLQLLLYHMMRGFTLEEDLRDKLLGRTLTGSRLMINQYHVTSTNITSITSSTSTVTTVNGARLLAGPQLAENGAVYWVSAVLAPPQPDLLSALRADPSGRFTVLLQTLQLAGLYGQLQEQEG